MKRLFSIVAVALASSFFAVESYAGDDDFGVDYSVGAEKKITKWMDFGLDFNFRTQDNNSKAERWSIGGAFGFKLYNTKRFDIKASAGWEYIRQQHLKSYEEKYGDCYDENQNWYYGVRGFNYNDSYWNDRHRTTVAISGSYKPNKRWNISLKEAVQYNHYAGTDSIFWKNRTKYNSDNEPYTTQTSSAKKAKDKFVLRSKLTAQYDIKHSMFAPFASVDYGCGLNYTANKWKLSAGTDIKINKHHKFNVYYRFQTEDDDDEPNGHILGVGYNFKF